MFENPDHVSYLQDAAGQIEPPISAPVKPSTVPRYVETPVRPEDGREYLPFYMRSNISPYLLNYPEAGTTAGYAGIFDETFSAKATPFKTALATSAFLLIGAAAGYSIEKTAAGFWNKKFKKSGYGALYGAVVANAIRMSLASGISSGFLAASTALAGGLLPVAAIFGVQEIGGSGKKLANKSKLLLGASGAAFVAVPLIITLVKKE